MKKEVTACDYVVDSGYPSTEHNPARAATLCPTFATEVCTFCSKDFCRDHIAGSFRVVIETVSKMFAPTAQAAASPMFSIVQSSAGVTVCQRCGTSLYNALSLNQSFTKDVAKESLIKAIEAACASMASYKLAQQPR